jgi:hypothetical protein
MIVNKRVGITLESKWIKIKKESGLALMWWWVNGIRLCDPRIKKKWGLHLIMIYDGTTCKKERRPWDKSRFGEQEQRVAHSLEMEFQERNPKQGVRSSFLPRLVETSWILACNLHLSFILCQACIDICSYIYPCGFWGIQTSHYVNSWSFNIWF